MSWPGQILFLRYSLLRYGHQRAVQTRGQTPYKNVLVKSKAGLLQGLIDNAQLEVHLVSEDRYRGQSGPH